MLRLGQEHILLIGDARHEIEAALSQALPSAVVRSVPNVFDGIAELSSSHYSAVLAAAEPIEARPEAAVAQLRKLAAGGGRLILFGQPDTEPLSRRMLSLGCDDYLITPPTSHELQQIFGSPTLRIAPDNGYESSETASGNGHTVATNTAEPATENALLAGLPLAELLLDAQLEQPIDALGACIRKLNAIIDTELRFHYLSKGQDAPVTPGGLTALAHAIRNPEGQECGQLVLHAPATSDNAQLRHFLAQLGQVAAKLLAVQQRHAQLQTLAITDPLTGAYNRRWFEHFLAKVLKRAQVMRFWVTLLIFDIDNFKKYNDEYGHGMGDEILRETATLMKRSCREHDLVARIGGDEFAVIFWDKEPPRQPKDPVKPAPTRPPQEPMQIFERFRRLMASRDFPGLGGSGQGKLTISGGLASYPWDGRDVNELVAAADHKLMFHAKRQGKNTIVLVGEDPPPAGEG